MSLHQIKIHTSGEFAEFLSDWLLLFGAVSVSFLDAQDQPIYEPPQNTLALWSDMYIVGLFDENISLENIGEYIKQQLPENTEFSYEITDIEIKDWEKIWMQDFHAVQFGDRLWICPSHEIIEDENAIKIMLDPGLAFGTGSHPTTFLCLEWISQNIFGGETVIDYGCGSGILALAAVKCGAKKVYAIDNDPQAIQATLDNATKNDISNHLLETYLPEHLPKISVDILIANILANPLIELAELFSHLVKSSGKIILSGILQEQTQMVIDAYKPWFDITSIEQKDEWVRLDGVKK